MRKIRIVIIIFLKNQFLLKKVIVFKNIKVSLFMKFSVYEVSIISLNNMGYKYCCQNQSQYNLHP